MPAGRLQSRAPPSPDALGLLPGLLRCPVGELRGRDSPGPRVPHDVGIVAHPVEPLQHEGEVRTPFPDLFDRHLETGDGAVRHAADDRGHLGRREGVTRDVEGLVARDGRINVLDFGLAKPTMTDVLDGPRFAQRVRLSEAEG